MSRFNEDIAEQYGITICESDKPDRLKIDFTVYDDNDGVAEVYGSGETVSVDNKEYYYDYEVECDHSTIEYGDDDERGYCVVCGCECDWHYEKEWLDEGHDEDGNCIGQEIEVRVPHEWHRGDGGIIKQYIEEKYGRK